MRISKTTWFIKGKKICLYLCVDSRLSSSWTSGKFWFFYQAPIWIWVETRPEPRRWSCQMQFWNSRRSFNAPLSFPPEKHQHVWHRHPVLPPEGPRAARRGGIPTLIPLCFSKCGRLIAIADSSRCLLPSQSRFPPWLHPTEESEGVLYASARGQPRI